MLYRSCCHAAEFLSPLLPPLLLLLPGLSALDKAKGDRQILQWAGVDKNYSAGIKDEPIED
jgi:hypothetical protein